MRQILITAVVSHMDGHEIIAIFVVDLFPNQAKAYVFWNLGGVLKCMLPQTNP